MYHQQTNQSQQAIEQTMVIQERFTGIIQAELPCNEQKTRSNTL